MASGAEAGGSGARSGGSAVAGENAAERVTAAKPAAPAVTPAERALTLAAGVLLVLLLLFRIDAPWRFIHDDNGAWTQAVAAAHLKAGLARTKGQDFLLRRAGGALVPYLHHPPLYPLVMAGAYRAAGSSGEALTRAVPALFHLLGFVGFVLLARLSFPNNPARRSLAACLYALVPMSAFFGKMPFNEPLGLCGVVWALWCTALYRRDGRREALGAAVIFWVLAGFTSWPAFPILFGVFLLFALEAWRERRPGAALAACVLGVTGIVAFALVLAHLTWAAGGRTPPLFTAGNTWGVHRMAAGPFYKAVGRALDFHRIYFANVPFLLFAVWIGAAVRGAVYRPGAVPEPARLLLAGALGCALWALLFVRQVALHAYGQFWFLPFEALAASDLAVRLWGRLEPRPRLRAWLAAAAIGATVVSSSAMLAYRYGETHAYAVRTARGIAETYETAP